MPFRRPLSITRPLFLICFSICKAINIATPRTEYSHRGTTPAMTIPISQYSVLRSVVRGNVEVAQVRSTVHHSSSRDGVRASLVLVREELATEVTEYGGLTDSFLVFLRPPSERRMLPHFLTLPRDTC